MAEDLRSHRAKLRRDRRRRVVVTGVGIVVVVGGGAAAVAATTGGGSTLRTAAARIGSVDQTVESSGTIASSQKAAASFSVSGTVKSVAAKVGSTVSKGQVLAQLDTTSLRGTVYTDETTLATAKQKLEADKTGQTTTSAGNGGNSSGAGATPSSYNTSGGNQTTTVTVELVDDRTKSSSGTDLAGLVKQITAAQPAVINGQKHIDTTQAAIDTAQKKVDTDIVQNTKFGDAQQTACAGIDDTATDSPTPTPTTSPSSSTPTATPTPTATATTSPTPPVPAACTTAMANYEAFATTLTTDMNTLSGLITTQDRYIQDLKTASNTLDGLIAKLPAAAANSGSGKPTTTGPSTSPTQSGKNKGSQSPNSSQSGKNKGSQPPNSSRSGKSNDSQQPSSVPSSDGGFGSGSGNAGSGQSNKQGQAGQGKSGTSGQSVTSAPASAAQLAADQGTIDAAQETLVVDQQNLAAATLRSPISGTVAEVGITAGSSPSGDTITIVGTGIQQADISVPLGEIDLVKVGQHATLTADGSTKKLHGTVRSVGILSSTSGSSTTFPVTVELDADSPALFDGSGADVTINTASATNVITVPNSAIHPTGNGRHTVTVVDGNKTTPVPVTVGVVGSALTQIKSGLKVGQRVVLADPSQKLPSSSTSGNTGGTFRFPGGFGGGGFNVGARPGG